MAADATPNDFVALILGLPPQLQGIVLLGVGIGGGWMVWKKFIKSYMHPPEEPKGELLVGESATFADLQPIRELVKQMDTLTLQMMANEARLGEFTGSISDTVKVTIRARQEAMEESDRQQRELMQALRELADLLSQHLVDLRQEREEREDQRRIQEALEEGRRQGHEQALAELASRRKRPPSPPGE